MSKELNEKIKFLQGRINELERKLLERKQIKERLEASEVRFRRLFESAQDGILILDANTGQIVEVNPLLIEMLGYSREEFLGKKLWDISFIKDIASSKAIFLELQTKGYVRYEDLPLQTKDGRKIEVEFVSNTYVVNHEKVIQCNIRDITERKRAEEELGKYKGHLEELVKERTAKLELEITERAQTEGALRESEIRLYTVLETIQEGITLSDEAGHFYIYNSAMEKLTGYSREEANVCSDFINLLYPDPEEQQRALQGITELFESGTSRETEMRMLTKDGQLKCILIWSSLTLYGGRRMFLSAYRDITERKQAEETLRKLSSAVRQTADVVIITNKDGVVEYVNPAFEKVTGYTKRETVGQTPRILKSGKHDQSFYEILWKTVLSGNFFHDILINKKKNGELYYALKTITPIKDEAGNITHFVSVDKDITERKEMEKRERLAQLGELVADMAHEVNNPLMIISGNAQISLMEEIQNENVKENLKIIFDECRRAKDIIQRLLKFSRPSRGELREIDINKSIEAVVGIVEHQFELSSIEIIRDYTKDLPIISVDEQQMAEVFMNLLNNSKDAMPKGGVITISTSLAGNFLKIDFKDTGWGMENEVMGRIFEPFFTTKEKGTGLGLSVCYGIIRAHNGELKFKSELHKGTVATILLPLGEDR